jgi:hypothetical protein
MPCSYLPPRADIEKDPRGDDKNLIKQAIEPDYKEYGRLMAGAAGMPVSTPTAQVSRVKNVARPVAHSMPALSCPNSGLQISHSLISHQPRRLVKP